MFGPDYSHVVLRPRPGYVPKVPTTPFRDQVVNLQALPSEEADPALELLCPVRALRIYVDRTRSFRSSEQLFVCYGGQQKGKAVSKQRFGPLDSGCHRLGVPIPRRAVPHGGEGSLHTECCLLLCVSARSFSGQTSVELRAGRTPNTFADSTVSALSQFLPVCWVTGKWRKNWPVSRLLRHSLSPGIRAPVFLLQFSSPDGEPWWSSSSTPGSQTGRNSLTPGPVLVLARPGLRSAPVLG